MLTSSDFQIHSYPLASKLNILPIRLKVLVALKLGTHEHYTHFSLTVLLLFIQVIRGRYQSQLWEESRIVWRGVMWVAIFPVVWLYCFSPFPDSLPTIFPRQKNIKQLMHLQLTGGGRVNSAGCIIYLLLRQGYHSMRLQSPFPPGPTAEACSHSFASITISLSSTSSIYYHPTLPGDTTTPSLNSLQKKGASHGLNGSRRSSTGISSSSSYQGMFGFTQLLHNDDIHTSSQTAQFWWYGCTIRARNGETTTQTQGLQIPKDIYKVAFKSAITTK